MKRKLNIGDLVRYWSYANIGIIIKYYGHSRYQIRWFNTGWSVILPGKILRSNCLGLVELE